MNNIINVQAVTKIISTPSYQPKGSKYPTNVVEKTLLDGITFELSAGSVTGLIGTSESGKSLLASIIAGLVAPSFGKIEVDGKIVFVQQHKWFDETKTGLQNIQQVAKQFGLTDRQAEIISLPVVQFSLLQDFINEKVASYSSSMQAQLALAIAVHLDPDVLILDSVSSIQNERFNRQWQEKVEEFKNQKRAIIYTQEVTETIHHSTDEIIWLHNGKLIQKGAPNVVIPAYMNFLQQQNDCEFVDEVAQIEAQLLVCAQVDPARPEASVTTKEVVKVQEARPHTPMKVNTKLIASLGIVAILGSGAYFVKDPVLGYFQEVKEARALEAEQKEQDAKEKAEQDALAQKEAQEKEVAAKLEEQKKQEDDAKKEEQPKAPAVSTKEYIYVKVSSANVRKTASKNADVVGQVAFGKKFEILGKKVDSSEQDTTWYKIKLANGTEGWIFSPIVTTMADSEMKNYLVSEEPVQKMIDSFRYRLTFAKANALLGLNEKDLKAKIPQEIEMESKKNDQTVLYTKSFRFVLEGGKTVEVHFRKPDTNTKAMTKALGTPVIEDKEKEIYMYQTDKNKVVFFGKDGETDYISVSKAQ